MNTCDLKIARKRIQAYCSYQERCHQEVNKKLKSWGLTPKEIDFLINELIQFNFLNEERFARSFSRGRFRIKKWGKNKIRFELKKRGIYDKWINLAIEEIDEKTYFKTLIDLLEKKTEQENITNSNRRKLKIIDYLASKGYEYDLIRNALDEMKYN